jgi:hypothetical protein
MSLTQGKSPHRKTMRQDPITLDPPDDLLVDSTSLGHIFSLVDLSRGEPTTAKEWRVNEFRATAGDLGTKTREPFVHHESLSWLALLQVLGRSDQVLV